MRMRTNRPILPALSICCCSACKLPDYAKSVDSAKALYDKGADAEARQNYEQAFDYFKQAYNQRPKDLRYRASYERLPLLCRSLARAPRADSAR